MKFMSEFGAKEYLYLQLDVISSLQVRSVREKGCGVADAEFVCGLYKCSPPNGETWLLMFGSVSP